MSRYVMAANPESSQYTADLHELSQVTIDHRESSQVTVDIHVYSQATVDHHESSHACFMTMPFNKSLANGSTHLMSRSPRNINSLM